MPRGRDEVEVNAAVLFKELVDCVAGGCECALASVSAVAVQTRSKISLS